MIQVCFNLVMSAHSFVRAHPKQVLMQDEVEWFREMRSVMCDVDVEGRLLMVKNMAVVLHWLLKDSEARQW